MVSITAAVCQTDLPYKVKFSYRDVKQFFHCKKFALTLTLRYYEFSPKNLPAGFVEKFFSILSYFACLCSVKITIQNYFRSIIQEKQKCYPWITVMETLSLIKVDLRNIFYHCS